MENVSNIRSFGGRVRDAEFDFATKSNCSGGSPSKCDECRSVNREVNEKYKIFFSKSACPPDSGSNSDFTARFYSWKTISKPREFDFGQSEHREGRKFKWESRIRTVYGTSDHGIVMTSQGKHDDKKECLGNTYYDYLNGLHRMIEKDDPKVTKNGWSKWNIREQSDTLQGDIDQTSTQESNTIITVDTSETRSMLYTGNGPRLNLVSTEEYHEFPTIMNRWMPFSNVEINTNQGFGSEEFYWNLPEVFYTDTVTPNLSQFRNFIFGELDIELRFIVNAHKFQAGKLVIAIFPDSYQGMSTRRTVFNALQMQHVIIDLNGNNHGLLEVPFRYRRPLLRLVNHANSSKGVRPALYASVGCYVLSPLVTGAGQAQNCYMRAFFRLKQAKLGGMSQQVTVQMDKVTDFVDSFNGTLKSAEKTLVRAGKIINWDKPQDVTNIIQVVPRPRLNFFTGTGLSDAIQMRVHHNATDVLPEPLYRVGDPQSTFDIARIWGYHASFNWSSSNTAGTSLYSWVIDPAHSQTSFVGTPSPFTFINGLYNFWSGPIDIRLDFVSNDFITGTVQVTFEPNRPAANETEAQSTYTKTFHLGSQKTLDFTIPYINDNCYRRTGVVAWSNWSVDFGSRNYEQRRANTVRMVPRNTLSVRVINPLRTVGTTTNTINVIVFIRAGANYCNLSPIMSTWETLDTTIGNLTLFPGEFSTVANFRDGSVSIPDLYGEVKPVFSKKSVDQKGGAELTTAPHLGRRLFIDGKDSGRYIDHNGRETYVKRVIHEQMDKGEKEDMDDTITFGSGVSRINMAVTDRHDNILDILRRPVLIWSGLGITGNALGNLVDNLHVTYIPVMPPGPMWKYQDNYNIEDLFNPSVYKTPQAALVSTFRHWRGSLRFTLVAYQTTGSTPIYVSYIPHNGTLLFGNQDYPRGSAGAWAKDVGPASCGLITEMIIPTVNPTLNIEIPFENELDYLLTSEEDRTRNYAWREKGLYCNGHLAITSSVNCAIDVWVSAGDSFYLCDFIGTYGTRSEASANMPNDDNPSLAALRVTPKPTTPKPTTAKTQADFSLHNMRNTPSVVGIREQMDRLTDAYNGLITHPLAVPIAGVASLATGLPIAQSVAAGKASYLLDKVTGGFEMLVEFIKNTISSIVGVAGCIINGISANTFVIECVLDAVLLMRKFDMVGFVICGVKFVLKLLSIDVSKLLPHLQSIIDCAGRLFSPTPREQLSGVGDDTEQTLVALLAGVIGNAVNVVFSKDDRQSWLQGLTLKFTSIQGLGVMNSCYTFVKNFYEVIKRMILSAIGYADVQTQTCAFLAKQVPSLKQFVDDVNNCTSIMNKNVRTSYPFRVKYWKTCINAQLIRSALSLTPSKAVNSNMLRICNEMIKHAQDNAYECAYSPVRYTPLVLCLAGPSNIGKSYCIDALATKMLDAIGYTSRSGSEVYVRNPTEKHWNGFCGQKVVQMDDVFNLVDPENFNKTLADMYALKTTALFIPEQADISAKGKPENPYYVIQATNSPFPEVPLSAACLDKKAVYRRRDILVNVTLKSEYASIADVPSEVLKEFGHLEFALYIDPTDAEKGLRDRMGWNDFTDVLRTACESYHAKETANVRYRMNEIMARMDASTRVLHPDTNPMGIFDEIMNASYNMTNHENNAYLPSEVLAAQLEQMCSQLDTLQIQSAGTSEQSFMGILDYFPRIMEEVYYLIREKTRKGIRGIMNYFGDVTRVCSVCHEEKICMFECSSGHPACRSCVRDSCQSVENSTVCGSSMNGIFSRGALGILYVARALLRGVLQPLLSVTEVLQIVYDVFYKFHEHFSLLGGAIGYYLRTIGKARSFTEASCYITDLYLWDSQLKVKINSYCREQGGFTFTGEAPRFEKKSLAPNQLLLDNDIRLSTAGVKRMFENRVDRLCNHKSLLDNADIVEYVEGNWRMYVGGALLQVPDVVCVKCCMTEEKFFNFMSKYVERCSHVLSYKIADALNQGKSFDGFIPQCLIPQPVTDEEVALDIEEPLLMRVARVLGYVCVGIAAIYAGKQFYTWWTSNVQEQIEFSGDPVTRHFQQAKQQKIVRSSIVAQNDQFEDVLIDKVIANAFYMELKYRDGKCITLAMMGIRSRIVLLPRHYFLRIQRDIELLSSIRIGRSNDRMVSFNYTFDESDFLVSSTSDIAVFYAPKQIEMFKDIVKYMQTDGDLRVSMASTGVMVRIPSTHINHFMRVPLDFRGFEKDIKVSSSTVDFVQSDVLCYNYSNDGACGSFVLKNHSQRPIVGMHIAGIGEGSNGTGYSVLITQDMVQDIPQQSLAVAQEDIPLEPASESRFLMPSDVLVSYQGTAPAGVFMPKKSKIIPSLLQGVIEYPTLTKPCYLSKEESGYQHEHSPLVAGCMKHGKLTLDFSTTAIEEAKQYLYDRYFIPMEPIVNQAVILSIDEAIGGFNGIDGYDAMKLDTSIGYPLNTMGVVSKKEDIEIIRDESSDIIDIKLSDRVYSLYRKDMELRKMGIVPATIFTAFLKDERKKLEKREKLGATRIFLMSSAHYTIAKRQHYLHYTAAQYGFRGRGYSACGIRCDSNEWSQLARNLLSKGNNIFTLDYSNFGPGFNTNVNFAMHKNVKKWLMEKITYPKDYPIEPILDCFAEEHGNSLHIMKDLVYRQLCGGPSGDPCTVNHNSDVNAMYIAIAWAHVYRSQKKGSISEMWRTFEENVFFKVYGDDLIASVTDQWKELFNAKTISTFFADYKIVATDAGKGDEIVPYTTIDKATFLKRGFLPHPKFNGEWLAPLDFNSVTETCQWIFKSPNDKEATQQNAEASIRQAYGHGRAVFSTHKDKVNRALCKAKMEPISISWDQIDQDFFPAYY